MRVLAAYGLQSGRYQITQMAETGRINKKERKEKKEKRNLSKKTQTSQRENKKYDITNDIFLDVWRGVLLAALGMAHLVGSFQSRLWVRGRRCSRAKIWYH
jgi:hypothetical protein